MTYTLMCIHMIFSSVWVVEWPPFGKELYVTICSQSFGDVSFSVCSYIFRSVWLVEWPSAHSVDHMFSLYFDYL